MTQGRTYPRHDRSRPLSQVDVERAIEEESERLEVLTNGSEEWEVEGYAEVCSKAAQAEAEWKMAFHKGMILQANRGSRDRKDIEEARVHATHEDKFREYKMAAARRDAAKEALVTSRSVLDALRTIAANVRAQT